MSTQEFTCNCTVYCGRTPTKVSKATFHRHVPHRHQFLTPFFQLPPSSDAAVTQGASKQHRTITATSTDTGGPGGSQSSAAPLHHDNHMDIGTSGSEEGNQSAGATSMVDRLQGEGSGSEERDEGDINDAGSGQPFAALQIPPPSSVGNNGQLDQSNDGILGGTGSLEAEQESSGLGNVLDIDKVREAQQFIEALQKATLENCGMEEEDIERLRNPPEESFELTDPALRFSLDIYLGVLNASEAIYNSIRDAYLRRHPNEIMFSLDQIK
ncbi:hypothetical protein BDN71DRAFT_1594136 [Pleurotus eryngii]|uniref:Uncharacterized protein n=1 Tax=Pleurotus eryngii TaxID=5323 RepID=A0A9P6D226_PLEER|nr:hypothetical protein BDN71DRAFT_1594136 [Pleurotus eryngii]